MLHDFVHRWAPLNWPVIGADGGRLAQSQSGPFGAVLPSPIGADWAQSAAGGGRGERNHKRLASCGRLAVGAH